MEKVVIFGGTDRAVLAHFYLTHDSPYEVAAFTVDREFIREERLCGLPVVPFEDVESVYPPAEYKMLVAVAFSRVNKVREEKYLQAKTKGYTFVTYISSKATVWPGVVIGDNCFIEGNTIIEPYVRIGNDVIAISASIGHNSTIKDHCFLAPHSVVLGCVTVEPNCVFGANATVRDRVVVARESVIGAGVLVLGNTRENEVYRGRLGELLSIPSNELRGT